MIMHDIVPSRRQRMIYGSAIIIAANCGGALTVIGDTTGLLLWTNSMVTATDFSMTLMIPCLISWIVPTLWLSRMLPERIDSQWRTMPYRGDDTNLKIWQRLVMLIVGIGGLWFIPTFHNITKLSPFIGALCVLSVLWIVNEVMNSKMMDVDKMIQRRVPFVLQYGVVQLALFVMGIMLAIGVVQETGVIAWLSRWCSENIHNVWLMGVIAAAFSTVLDTFASALSFISLFPDFPLNAIYWKIIAYSTAMGGSTLMIGSVAGLALMKMEHIRVGWYLRNIGWVVILSWLMGMAVLYMMN
jgi:Na+/H+ antiporter NhaD/arsenite permease-like protein